LKRAFGNNEVPLFDPFLLLDDFHSENPADYIKGFPWHPHRGIETITYMLNGEVEHGDSMGNSGVICPGDVQWMTAGSGIIHQEMPKGEQYGTMWGFQLWANLPASHKMIAPRYRDVWSSQIPEITVDSGVTVKLICGEVNGVNGPVKDIVIEPEYLDVNLLPRSTFRHRVKRGHTAIAYILEGAGRFVQGHDSDAYKALGTDPFSSNTNGLLSAENVVLFDNGDEVNVATEDNPVRFLLIAGKPIGEPVAWYGPIVMNTQQELREAFEEYQRGTFLKHGKANDQNRQSVPYPKRITN
jgi:redox-sensitive bicupin YhaK (pirin superfamily)